MNSMDPNVRWKENCIKILKHFERMFSFTPAVVIGEFRFGDYVIEITENGHLVNKFIITSDSEGNVNTFTIKGMNLGIYYTRYRLEHKVLWYNASDCEKDAWGEYLKFQIES